MNKKHIRYFSFFLVMGLFLSFLSHCKDLEGLTKSLADSGLIPKEIHTGLVAANKLHDVYEAYSKEFTPKEEYYIGRTVAAYVLSKKRMFGNGRSSMEQYVQKIGHTLAMASNRPGTFQDYRFIVLKNPSVNAYAVPSGYIFITTGLIKLANNEDELAGVLAHEVSHIVLKHPVESISDAKKTESVAELGKFAVATAASSEKSLQNLTGLFNEVIGEVQKSVENGYNADKEKEADMNSVGLLIKCGYDPKGLSSMLRKLKVGGGVHGDPKVRANNVDGKVNEFGKNVPAVNPSRTNRFKRSINKGALAYRN